MVRCCSRSGAAVPAAHLLHKHLRAVVFLLVEELFRFRLLLGSERGDGLRARRVVARAERLDHPAERGGGEFRLGARVVRARRRMQLIDQRIGELERRPALVVERRLSRLEVGELRIGELENPSACRSTALAGSDLGGRPAAALGETLLVLLAEHLRRCRPGCARGTKLIRAGH